MKKQIIIIIVLLIISSIIGIMVYNGINPYVDTIGYNLLVKNLRNPFLTSIMKIITVLGNPETIIVICIITSILVFQKNKQLSMIISLNLIMITCINQILKEIIERPRPTGYRLLDINGYSFPSGHAMVSLAFYGLYIYLINKTIKNKKLKIFLNTILSVIIILIGISRIYLGVHYLSDILVGFFLSIIYLLAVTNLLNKYIFNSSQNIP